MIEIIDAKVFINGNMVMELSEDEMVAMEAYIRILQMNQLFQGKYDGLKLGDEE
jgi:hypothetical protein